MITKKYLKGLILLTTSLIVLGCAKDDSLPDGTPAEKPGNAEAKDISPNVITQEATYFNNLFNLFGGGWTGGDGAYSIPLPDGRLLWTFGDTFLGTVNEDYTRNGPLINNTFVIQDGDQLTTLYGGTEENPEAYVRPLDNPNHWYWPADGIVLDGKLYMFMSRIRSTGEIGIFSFEQVGTDLTVFSLPGLEMIGQYQVARTDQYLMGVNLYREENFVYVYGTRSTFRKNAVLARFDTSNPLDIRYWDGEGWSDTFVPDVYLKKGNGENLRVSNQLTVFKQGDDYRLLVQDDFAGSEIRVYTSDSPTGPWFSPQIVYETPETGLDNGNLWTYNAYAHPHIEHPEKGILVTYSVNTFDFWSLFQDARIYRPRFLWVKEAGLIFRNQRIAFLISLRAQS